MFGLTTLGAVHTAISLGALGAGAVALLREQAITPADGLGKVYLWTTVLTCLTGFGIFQHGGLGPPHVLGLLTLLVLGVATIALKTAVFGRASKYIATVGYSVSFFFHLIPGATETFTRLPLGAPLFRNADDPNLQKVVGVLFVLLVLGSLWQIRRLRAKTVPVAAAKPA
jgi:uncharacterized membrane protein